MRLRLPRTRRPATGAVRAGVAAVEMGWTFAVFVVPLVIGIWEVGRMVQVQQIVSNAAREAARLAGQGTTIRSDGTIVQINTAAGTPNLRDVVYQYLVAAGLTGLTAADYEVLFAFTTGNTGNTQPYQGIKNQQFSVTVRVKWEKVRWVNLGVINPQWVTFTVNWRMLVDDPFTLNETLPTF